MWIVSKGNRIQESQIRENKSFSFIFGPWGIHGKFGKSVSRDINIQSEVESGTGSIWSVSCQQLDSEFGIMWNMWLPDGGTEGDTSVMGNKIHLVKQRISRSRTKDCVCVHFNSWLFAHTPFI